MTSLLCLCDQCCFRCAHSLASSYFCSVLMLRCWLELCRSPKIPCLTSTLSTPAPLPYFFPPLLPSAPVSSSLPSGRNRPTHGPQHPRVCFRGGPVSAGAGERPQICFNFITSFMINKVKCSSHRGTFNKIKYLSQYSCHVCCCTSSVLLKVTF